MRTKIKICFVCLLLLLSCTVALAADSGVTVQAAIDRATVQVGDRITLTVNVKYRGDCEIKFPEFKDEKINDFEIKDRASKVKKGFFGRNISSRTYYLAAYSTGKHQIPPVEVKYRRKSDKEWKAAATRALNITIESVLPAGKMPADIKDVKGPLSYFELNRFLVGGILIAIIVIVIVIMRRLRKPPAPVRLPHETALEELEAIRSSFLKDPDVKEYYAGISDCIRRYIERSFRVRAPEMTTEEFLSSLGESTVLALDWKDLLKDFLNACDLVKFAKYAPERGEMDTVYIAAKKFIDQTKGMTNVRL